MENAALWGPAHLTARRSLQERLSAIEAQVGHATRWV